MTTKSFVTSKLLEVNANGDFPLLGLNSLTLGLKSSISVTLLPLTPGISFPYLSLVKEFTENKSPTLPLATLNLSNIIRSFFDGIGELDFLTILE